MQPGDIHFAAVWPVANGGMSRKVNYLTFVPSNMADFEQSPVPESRAHHIAL